jgi:hypothetical protein
MSLETQLLMAVRLKFFSLAEIQPALDLAAEEGKMLNVLMNKVNAGERKN